jgi:hypothetical protein
MHPVRGAAVAVQRKPFVIPAKAGIHSPVRWGLEPERRGQWIPAFAGMTG